MPLLVHAVTGTLGMHGQAIQLSGEPYGKITDVNHLLHFSQTFLVGFTHFVRHQLAQVSLHFAKGIADLTNDLSTLGSRHQPPRFKCNLRLSYHGFVGFLRR